MVRNISNPHLLNLPTIAVFSFAASFCEVDKDLASRFTAQLYSIVKMGLPVAGRRGQGRPGIWSPGDVAMLITALQLWQIGVAPSRIVSLLTTCWDRMRLDISNAGTAYIDSHATGIVGIDPNTRRFWRVKLDGLSIYARKDRPHIQGKYDTIETITGQELLNYLHGRDWEDYKYVLIDVEKFVANFLHYARARLYPWDSLPAIIASLNSPWSPPATE